METESQELTIKTAPVGHTFTSRELKSQCRVIFGGIAYPGKRPGFGVVLGGAGNGDIYVLDETESADLRVLIRRCATLDQRYRPQSWYGDGKNRAALRFIEELEAEHRQPGDVGTRRRRFCINSTYLLDMETPYSYLLAAIKALLAPDHRELFLKDSGVVGYLSQVKPDEIPFLEFGEYPAFEALAFAVEELQSWLRQEREPRPRNTDSYHGWRPGRKSRYARRRA
jgi:hypothetical protein